MSAYIPDEGDVVWISLDPTIGREQAGHRPAIVLTRASYNRRSGLMFCVPLTRRSKGYPFEVRIGSQEGTALVDQARAVDWAHRGISREGRLDAEEMDAVRTKLRMLIG